MPKRLLYVGVCVVSLVAAVERTALRLAAEDSLFAKAEAALAEARARELVESEEYDSFQMAHAAAREIARAERGRVVAAMQKLATVGTSLAAAEKAGRESEVAALRQEIQNCRATLRAATGQMLADSRTASKASDEVLREEFDMRAKMAAAREAENALLQAKAKAAEQADAEIAGAARLAVHQLELLRGIEAQQWPRLRRQWAAEFAEHLRESVKLAKQIMEVEQDASRGQELAAFSDEQGRKLVEIEKIVAESQQAEEVATPRLYALRAAASGGLKLLAPEQWDHAKARHLMVRAGFGGTPQEVAKLHELGLYRAVDYLVEYYRQPGTPIGFDPVPPRRIDPLYDRITVRTMNSRVVADQKSIERGQIAGLRQAWLRRMVESPRPLQEKLALFWHGHFACQDSVVQNSYTMFRQNQLFREHAAGNFGALLYGIVHDPAMLRYLDNNQNVKGQPNENLAREILELFSMGVDQGYTERDIVEAARALTGYTYDDTTGGFRFVHNAHDATEKSVFGQQGNWTGDDLVRLILERPETSRFIARRLFEYFVDREPDPATVESLATVLRVNHFDLEPLLKNLFMSEEFYSPRAMGHQIKSPVELVVGLMRDLGAKQAVNYGAVDGAIRQMGMELLEPPDVKGWRYGRSWINSQRLFVRYNSTANLVRSVTQPGNARAVNLVAWLQSGGCTNTSEVVNFLEKACLIVPLSEGKRQELVRYFGELPPQAQWNDQRDELNRRLQTLLVLMLSVPEYQLS